MNETASTKTLLAAIVVSGVTTFMFYPLITLELLDRGHSTLAVGVILGLLSGVGPTLSVFIGHVNAIFGSKKLAIAGLFFRSLGLSVFVFDTSLGIYAVGSVVASLSSGALALALKTELMRTSTSRRMITLRSIMVNIGALVGPSLGGVLFFFSSFSTVVLIVVISYIFLACALLTVQFQPPEKQVRGYISVPKRSDLNQPFLLLCVCVLGYWTTYSLWPLVVPIIANQGFGTPIASGWVYTGNAVLILTLQYWLVVKHLSEVKSADLLALGFALFIAGFACILMPLGPIAVIGFATLFSLGEMLVSPTLDEITGRIDTGGLGLTRAYGLTGTVSGIGSLFGAPIGGMLIDTSGSVSGVLWLAVPMAGLSILAAFRLKQREVFS